MTLAEQPHLLCWTCGLRFLLENVFPCTELGYPNCDQELVIINPPKNPLPHCGGWIFAEELKEQGFSAQCCKCHAWVQWPDYKDFQKGICPSCGAQGY